MSEHPPPQPRTPLASSVKSGTPAAPSPTSSLSGSTAAEETARSEGLVQGRIAMFHQRTTVTASSPLSPPNKRIHADMTPPPIRSDPPTNLSRQTTTARSNNSSKENNAVTVASENAPPSALRNYADDVASLASCHALSHQHIDHAHRVAPPLVTASASLPNISAVSSSPKRFCVRVFLPRGTISFMQCDHTTTPETLITKANQQIKTLLGKSFDCDEILVSTDDGVNYVSSTMLLVDIPKIINCIDQETIPTIYMKSSKTLDQKPSGSQDTLPKRWQMEWQRTSSTASEVSESIHSSPLRQSFTGTERELDTKKMFSVGDIRQSAASYPAVLQEKLVNFKDQNYYADVLFPNGRHVRINLTGSETIKRVKGMILESASDILEPNFLLQYADPFGKMVELYDETQLFYSVSIIPTWQKTGENWLFHAVSCTPSSSKQVQLANKKIGNLIGFGLYRFDYINNIEKLIARVREEVLESRDPVAYQLLSRIDDSPPSESILSKLKADKIQFRLHIPFAEMIKTLTCSMSDTPKAIVNSAFAKLRLQEHTMQSHDLILKVCGLSEYLSVEQPMINFSYIRQCLTKNEKINLVLVSIEDILSPVETETIEEFNVIEDPSLCIGSHADHSIECQPEDSINVISLWDIARPFRVQITAAEKMAPGTVEAMYVEAGLYFGGELLCPPLKTHQVPNSTTPRWAEWLTFDIMCYNIPRDARICITVWGRWNAKKKMSQDRDTDLYPLGWVNFLVMDFKGYLKTGMHKITLWPNDKANPIGTCLTPKNFEDAGLYIRLDTYTHPVVFPKEEEKVDLSLLDNLPPISESDKEKLETILQTDPLTQLDAEASEFLRNNSLYCVDYPESIIRVMRSTRWNILEEVIFAKKLLKIWKPISASTALGLLDSHFGDRDIRAFAVNRLIELPDNVFYDFLLQLVQALKYEGYLDCALSRALLQRALKNKQIGHNFFWYLKSEVDDPEASTRFALLLEAYLRGSGAFMDELVFQYDVLGRLSDMSDAVKRAKNANERKEALSSEIIRTQFPTKFQLPLDPRFEAFGIIPENFKYMDSKKLPLWCEFVNADRTGSDLSVIFKAGDDLRQDMLTLQMIRIMDKLWQNENLDLRLLPYECISTGKDMGFIEVVLNAETISSIQLASGGSSAAFKEQPVDEWLRKHNPDEASYSQAVETFTRSCAGYCVATYILGIGDRHNDNIMITKQGHLFHIDFGHFLGNIKRKFGIKRERAPFVLTPDFVYVIGQKEGKDAIQFQRFIDYCIQAFMIIRRHSHMFIHLFSLMLSTGIPELRSVEDIYYLRDAMCLGMNDENAAREFRGLISESLRLGWSTQLNWWIHNLVHAK